MEAEKALESQYVPVDAELSHRRYEHLAVLVVYHLRQYCELDDLEVVVRWSYHSTRGAAKMQAGCKPGISRLFLGERHDNPMEML